jgi:hypothetical protein
MNFSQYLAICFELFSFGEFVYSEIADSVPHLSAAAAAWPPRAAPMPRLKAAVGTACHASRQLPRPRRTRSTAAPLSVPPPSPTAPASPTPPSPRPSPCRPRPPPDRLADRTAVPTGASLVDAAPVSRCSSAASRAPVSSRRRLAGQRRRRAACRRAVPRARAVRHALCGPAELGRAHGPRATLALCDWAERDFGPVAHG